MRILGGKRKQRKEGKERKMEGRNKKGEKNNGREGERKKKREKEEKVIIISGLSECYTYMGNILWVLNFANFMNFAF